MTLSTRATKEGEIHYGDVLFLGTFSARGNNRGYTQKCHFDFWLGSKSRSLLTTEHQHCAKTEDKTICHHVRTFDSSCSLCSRSPRLKATCGHLIWQVTIKQQFVPVCCPTIPIFCTAHPRQAARMEIMMQAIQTTNPIDGDNTIHGFIRVVPCWDG